jgi:hypothetical protein
MTETGHDNLVVEVPHQFAQSLQMLQQYFDVGPGRPCQLYVIIVGDHTALKSTSTTLRLYTSKGVDSRSLPASVHDT